MFGRDIRFLVEHGIIEKITERTESEEERKRERQLSELYGKLSYKELAEKFGVSVSTIKREINYLIAKGIIKRKSAVNIENRRAEVAKMFGKMNRRDMAKKFGVSVETIESDITFLRKQGIITTRMPLIVSSEKKEEIEQRRRQIIRIHNENRGKITVKEIASLLGISLDKAYRDVRALKKEGRIKDFDEEEMEQEDDSSNRRSPELEKRIKIIYQKIMSLYKEGKIDKAKELLRMLRRKNYF